MTQTAALDTHTVTVNGTTETPWRKHYRNKVTLMEFQRRGDVARRPDKAGSDVTGRPGWTFAGSYQNERGYLKALQSGVPTELAAQKYRELSGKLTADLEAALPHIPNARRRLVAREEGDSISVERYIDRDPACWEFTQRLSGVKRFINLGVNLVGSCVESENTFAATVCAATVLADALRQRGFAVRITGMVVCGTGSIGWDSEELVNGPIDEFGIYWPMLDYGETFTPEAMLAWGTAATTRFLKFGWADTGWKVRYWAGRGRVHPTVSQTVLDLTGVDALVHVNSTWASGYDSTIAAQLLKVANGLMEKLGLSAR